MAEKEAEIGRALKRANYFSILMIGVAPVAILVIIYLVTMNWTVTNLITAEMGMMPYVLITVALLDLFTAIFFYHKLPQFVLKMKSRGPLPFSGKGGSQESESIFERAAHSFTIVLLAQVESISVIGALFVIQGFSFEYMLPFVATTYLGFLLIRPRREFFERLYEKIEQHNSGVMT